MEAQQTACDRGDSPVGLNVNDIDGINAEASDEYGDWGPDFEITQEKINQFAELTGDHQWIHVDIEKANAGPFGGPIAHGFLTLSLLPAISPPMADLEGVAGAINYGADKLRFLAPVPAGSTVHAHGRLVKAAQKATGTLITTEVAIHVVGNEKPSVLYQMLVLYMGG
jgi:acyl dehydratase